MKLFLHIILITGLVLITTTSSTFSGNAEIKDRDKVINQFLSLRNRLAKGQETLRIIRIKSAFVVFNKENKDSSAIKKIKETTVEIDSLLRDYSEAIDFSVEEFDYNYKSYSNKNK